MTDHQHQSLKDLIALQGKSIKQYALKGLFSGDVDGDLAWQQLNSLRSDRIDESLPGRVSVRSVGEVLDEELSRDSRD